MFIATLRPLRPVMATMVEENKKNLRLSMQACTQTELFFYWAFLVAERHCKTISKEWMQQ